MNDTEINGHGQGHILAGRDISINQNNYHINKYSSHGHTFKVADQAFQSAVGNGVIERNGQPLEYCSKSLFTSLMRLGIPYDTAINIPFEIIPILASIRISFEDRSITTSDIREAVLTCINNLVYDDHTAEQIAMWSAAYIRRYGNPDRSSLRVHDNGEDVELNYVYVQKTIIPHLYKRIFAIDNIPNPIQKYSDVFSRSQLDSMAAEIVHFLNTLNVYTIRYKTLINLLEDLIVEPPHPWIVNELTLKSVTEYNLERAIYHLKQIIMAYQENNTISFNQTAQECFNHLAASILAKYGAYLGIGSRYGLLELKRALQLQFHNHELWRFCKLNEIENDLKLAGHTIHSFKSKLERIIHQTTILNKDSKYKSLYNDAIEVGKIVVTLTPEYKVQNKILQDILSYK